MSPSSSSRKRGSSELESSDSPPAKIPKKMFKKILREQTALSLRIAKQVFSTKTSGNSIMSPLSIHIALSMVAAGAGGPVKDQIISFLGAESDQQLHNFTSKATRLISSKCSRSSRSHDEPILNLANAIWLKDDFTFKSSFKQTVETDYKAVTKLLDFSKADKAARKVNKWVEKKTKGLINGVVSSDSFSRSAANLVLVNTLYFKGEWTYSFRTKQSKDRTFYLMDGKSVRVPFMCSGLFGGEIGVYDTFKVLNLPYCGDKYSMCIFLPNETDGLPSLLQRVCSDGEFLHSHMPKSREEVRPGEVRIPKFKIEVDFEVKNVVEQLGLKFGEMTEMVEEMHEAVIVSSIEQKAFVEVNEKGTEAAATARIGLATTCGRGPRPTLVFVDFIADHPFMFIIQEDSTGLVLFIGQVLDPSR